MQASRRQHYLAAMGVDCWLPRQQLPGAAPGPIYVHKSALPQQSPTSETKPIDSHVVSYVGNAAEPSTAELLQEGFADVVPSKSAVVRVPPRTAVPTPASNAPFQLAFYSWAPELLVVDEVHDIHLQQQLLSNLLFALGHRSLKRTLPDYFQWPLSGNRQRLDLSPHEMVFGALQRMLEQHKPAHMLLMGTLAAKHVLGVEEAFDADKSAAESSLYPGVTLLLTHSSSALLEQPLLKAETWQHLQSLRV